jgi:hypothetical protein
MKGVAKAIVVILALVSIDQYFDNGQYTDRAMAMVRDMRHSFLW